MFKILRLFSIMSIFVLIISACNLPSNAATQNPNDPNVVFTAAALTVQAQLTQAAPFNTPTLPPLPPTSTALVIPTAAPIIPTNTPIIPPTSVCDQATFISDVTIPDGTAVAPGSTFKKTWRLQNSGSCTWSGYSLVFDSGESMSPSIDPIGTVAPGQEVDVSVSFTAPVTSGDYKSYWRIRNPSGVLLPVLGGWQGKGFFVYIKIGSSGYDFHTRASTAVNGFAMYKNGQKLEDGTSPSKILETQPQVINDGVITGRYPVYTVTSGEHFKAKIGFLAQADGSCGAGNVKFQLNYKESGVLTSLGEWSKSCDGTLKSIDVDLTSLAGHSVEFVLGVLANGPATQDWAVWVSPQISIP
jgi:Ig-like domain from next to BRCA1 gene